MALVDDNGGFRSVRFENGVIHTESFMPHGHVASFSFRGGQRFINLFGLTRQ